MIQEDPVGIHENPATFTFRIKSLGECIGVLEMACKCIKHKKNIAQHLFPVFFLHFSAFLAPLSGGFPTRCASTVGPLLNFLSGVGDVPIGKR